MALLHKSVLTPTKLELLSTWLPGRSWFPGRSAPAVDRVGAARFDDPDGVVGIEILLVRVGGGPVLHVPLTYRGAPLDGAERFLAGTMHHSVLGQRWVYDACGDPVFARVLGDAIRDGAQQAVEELHEDGRVVVREPNLLLRGSGSAAPAAGEIVEVVDGEVTRVVTATGSGLEIFRTPGPAPAGQDAILTADWAGAASPVLLARLTA
ncbi:CG0192-related protein [Actinoplanes siamensis]|uniref:Maltokinase N-terminal cap domain-containing protein n=1 Tax=Actinoplanes siamensis TaxID=1223317 RepID=A0A919TKV0_9ACTN|nr:hypothetical protein [Actinoplanes siamensis]GIF05693.1 hypothetical protein Asi03nite_32310 [Actinoplanes siamensis]